MHGEKVMSKLFDIINSKKPASLGRIASIVKELDDGCVGDLTIRSPDNVGCFIINIYKTTTMKDGKIKSKVYVAKTRDDVLAWSEEKTL